MSTGWRNLMRYVDDATCRSSFHRIYTKHEHVDSNIITTSFITYRRCAWRRASLRRPSPTVSSRSRPSDSAIEYGRTQSQRHGGVIEAGRPLPLGRLALRRVRSTDAGLSVDLASFVLRPSIYSRAARASAAVMTQLPRTKKENQYQPRTRGARSRHKDTKNFGIETRRLARRSFLSHQSQTLHVVVAGCVFVDTVHACTALRLNNESCSFRTKLRRVAAQHPRFLPAVEI